MAALLWAGEGSVATHRTAAALLGLGEIEPGVPEISITKSRRPVKGIVIHRTGEIPSCDQAKLERLRITTVARTLIDLGAVIDDDALEVALEDGPSAQVDLPRAAPKKVEATSRQGKARSAGFEARIGKALSGQLGFWEHFRSQGAASYAQAWPSASRPSVSSSVRRKRSAQS